MYLLGIVLIPNTAKVVLLGLKNTKWKAEEQFLDYFLKRAVNHLYQLLQKTLDELFEVLTKAKELEGLRERTLTGHERHYIYFLEYLHDSYPEIKSGDDVTVDVIRNYIYYMDNEDIILQHNQWALPTEF